ncbi:MAG: radical SAM protein, partial [Treponema sp.]
MSKEVSKTKTVTCNTCPHHCKLNENEFGNCHARLNKDGKIISANYGIVSSLALDPIEKKPLRLFYPNSKILSVGSYGCNMHCQFCQNHDISQVKDDEKEFHQITDKDNFLVQKITPTQLTLQAVGSHDQGNIGVAFTYNEPLVGWEFVLETEKQIRYVGMKNVIVTNGCVTQEVIQKILPYTDAMNIDLKSFTDEGYKILGGDLDTVKNNIVECSKKCHVELTSLIVPGFNDSENDMVQEAKWIASIDKNIALHVTRFFPCYKLSSEQITDISSI